MAGIYVHFPFCRSKCIYCDFFSRVRGDRQAYLAALEREIDDRKDYLNGVPPRTVYFGGGTPSVFSPPELGRVMEKLDSVIGLSDVEESTVEVNPDDISLEKARCLRQIGFSRVSMGVQSFRDGHLQWMKRRHTAQQAVEAFSNLAKAGFGNISIDLIFGFEGLSDEDWDYNINRALSLGAQHISCYQMMGRYASADEEACRRQYERLQEALGLAGYHQYEVSNYCLDGFRSIHNSSYWKRCAYLGLGPGAHSFDGAFRRSWNLSDIEGYIASRPFGSETLSAEDVCNEKIMLSLRTAEGIGEKEVKKTPALDSLVRTGYIVCRDGRLSVPSDKLFVLDWIVGQLFV